MLPQTVKQMDCAMSLAMIITLTGVPLHCSSEAEETNQSFVIYFTVIFYLLTMAWTCFTIKD